MNDEKKPKETPRRAKGKTATSISLSEETLRKAKIAAERDGRPLSNWIERLLQEVTKNITVLLLLIAACSALFHMASGQHPAEAAFSGACDALHVGGMAVYFAGSCVVEIVRAAVS